MVLLAKYSTQNNGYDVVYIVGEWCERKKNELKYNKKRLIYGESNNFRSFIQLLRDKTD